MYFNQLTADQAKERLSRLYQEAETARITPDLRKRALALLKRPAKPKHPGTPTGAPKGGSYAS